MTLSKNSFVRFAAVASCVAVLTQGTPANAAETVTSVWQGVYTKEQAARGKARYFTSCAVCHGALLQGDSDSPELAGPSFTKRWGDQSVGTLFAFAMSQMPVGRPGSLGAQGYADVVAHILATNGFPDGLRPNGGRILQKAEGSSFRADLHFPANF